MWKSVTFLLILFVINSNCQEKNDKKHPRPVAEVKQGKLLGYHKLSYTNQTFSAFEGIPYAQPPVGKLRLKDPEPISKWTGTWDSIFVFDCLQASMEAPAIIHGQEDCLYLNIYVPNKQPDPKNKLEVIIHFHGGSFMFGSSHNYPHPEYFMDKNVIFITVNYRLGLFGFLSTQDDVIRGNFGLKDQAMALKWVQENIQNFGGNPKSVTITGMSSGGASVHYHYFSPLSKGLFQRGWSMSGTVLNSWALQKNPAEKAQILARAVNCPESSERLLACLQQRSYQQIYAKIRQFYGFQFLPIAPFGPVVENSKKPFLDKHPFLKLRDGKIVNDVPWLVSNAAHEGLFPSVFLARKLLAINEQWNELAPSLFDYNYTVPEERFEEIGAKIRKHYLEEEDMYVDGVNFPDFARIFSDRLYFIGAEQALRMHAKISKSPVYYYFFQYIGDNNLNHNLTTHGHDASYIFHKMNNNEQPTENDLKMRDLLLGMLVSFAKSGKPKIEGVQWEPTTFEQLKVLNITDHVTSALKLETPKTLTPSRDFWDSLDIEENEKLFK